MSESSLVDLEKLARYEHILNAFVAGETDADRFQSVHLQQGIYGQRAESGDAQGLI